MTDLLISDITRRGRSFCVIGLEHDRRRYASVRPLPTHGVAWSRFPYSRGQILRAQLENIPVTRPHVENKRMQGPVELVRSVSATELVDALKSAEFDNVDDLFLTPILHNSDGGAGFIRPGTGSRSICGCAPVALRFSLRFYDQDRKIRAELELPSGEKLFRLPLVDRDYFHFITSALGPNPTQQKITAIQEAVNAYVANGLQEDDLFLVRIGVAGSWAPEGRDEAVCWLMLDSIFPPPDEVFFNEILEGGKK